MSAASHSGRVLGLDYGAKRTGVALTDPSRALATPREPIAKANSSDGLSSIAALVRDHEVTRIIVGLPIGPNGDDTLQTQRCRSFAARVAQVVSVPVELHDERFTSRMADRTRAATGTEASRDSLAACHLLESWMETHDT